MGREGMFVSGATTHWNVRTGRQRQTIASLQWEPPYLGSQKYLLPALILERSDTTIIVDAKYKGHWEELSRERWSAMEQELRERHRADLLQILAYANLGTTNRVMVCLAYPCRQETWKSLQTRGRLFHRASISERSAQAWSRGLNQKRNPGTPRGFACRSAPATLPVQKVGWVAHPERVWVRL